MPEGLGLADNDVRDKGIDGLARLVRDLRADGGCFKQRPIAGVRLDESAADAALAPHSQQQTLHNRHIACQQFDPGNSADAATAQTIKSAAMPPVRISRFFCAVIKSPARMAFYKAYHMKETIAGIALSACSGPQHMVL